MYDFIYTYFSVLKNFRGMEGMTGNSIDFEVNITYGQSQSMLNTILVQVSLFIPLTPLNINFVL